jgi:hypothetical protein
MLRIINKETPKLSTDKMAKVFGGRYGSIKEKSSASAAIILTK